MSKGKLVILSGPSGVGKDTVLESWQQVNPRVARVVAYATRTPRPHEVNGLDYHFVSKDEFHSKAGEGHFLEFKEVYGNFYATPLTDMEQMLDAGKIAVLKIDVQGALTAMGLRKDATSIFLLPPDEGELLRRIRERGTEEGDVLDRRIRNAQDEMALADRYQFQVVNRDLSAAVARLEEIVNG